MSDGSPFRNPVPPGHENPRFQEAYDYWLSKCRGDKLPARSDLDPIDTPSLLGNIVLIEVRIEEERTRFRYRLWGSNITDIIGRDLTGQYLSDLTPPGRAQKIRDAMNEVIETRQPHYWEIPLPVEDRQYASYARLALPLATDGKNVDVIAAVIYRIPRL